MPMPPPPLGKDRQRLPSILTSPFATLVHKHGSGCCCLRAKVRVGKMRCHVLHARAVCHSLSSLGNVTCSCLTFGWTLIGCESLTAWPGARPRQSGVPQPCPQRLPPCLDPDHSPGHPCTANQPLNPPTPREQCRSRARQDCLARLVVVRKYYPPLG